MIFTFKIRLQEISKPPVWRRLQVPAQFTFHRMHQVIQAAFGWDDYHLYSFSPGGYLSDYQIAIPGDILDLPTVDPRSKKLSAIFGQEGETFIYEYDFGDSWMHHMTLEKLSPEKATRAQCVGGKGKCPPEDCGGPWGYADIKAELATGKPSKGLRDWLGLKRGETWDPSEFDLDRTNARVKSI